MSFQLETRLATFCELSTSTLSWNSTIHKSDQLFSLRKQALYAAKKCMDNSLQIDTDLQLAVAQHTLFFGLLVKQVKRKLVNRNFFGRELWSRLLEINS